MKSCFICGATKDIEKHHVFFGNPNRKHSEKHGLTVDLCPEHHRGTQGVHNNRSLDLSFKKIYQARFEEKHSREDFIATFGRNYL